VHDFSRFGRDSHAAKTTRRDLAKRGVQVRSLNDHIIDPETAAGVYMDASRTPRTKPIASKWHFIPGRVAPPTFRRAIRRLGGVTRTEGKLCSGIDHSDWIAAK
jgi:hypothetical protein